MKYKPAEHNSKHDVNSCCCVDCCWEREEAEKVKRASKKKKLSQEEIEQLNRLYSIFPPDCEMKVLKWPKL